MLERRCPCCGAVLFPAADAEGGMLSVCLVCGHEEAGGEIADAAAVQAGEAWRLRKEMRWDEAAQGFCRAAGLGEAWPCLWPALLCRYGLIYVHDSQNGWVPTCAKKTILRDRIEGQEDWRTLRERLSGGPRDTAEWFENERLRLEPVLAAIRKHEEDKAWDLFLCFPVRERTYRFASRLRRQLAGVKPDARVFFAPETLAGIGEEAFEGLICAGLRSAGRMCVILGPEEQPVTPWMENEILRFRTFHPGEEPRVLRLPGVPAERVPLSLRAIRHKDIGNADSLSDVREAAEWLMRDLSGPAEEEEPVFIPEPPAPIFQMEELLRLPFEISGFLFVSPFLQPQRYPRLKAWFEEHEGIWNGRHLSRFHASCGKPAGQRLGEYRLDGWGVGILFTGMKLESEDSRRTGVIVSIREDGEEKEYVVTNEARQLSLLLRTAYEEEKLPACAWRNG